VLGTALLSYASRKRWWFSKEELYIYMWRRGEKMNIETFLRYLRAMKRMGLVASRRINGTHVIYPIIPSLRRWLRDACI